MSATTLTGFQINILPRSSTSSNSRWVSIIMFHMLLLDKKKGTCCIGGGTSAQTLGVKFSTNKENILCNTQDPRHSFYAILRTGAHAPDDFALLCQPRLGRQLLTRSTCLLRFLVLHYSRSICMCRTTKRKPPASGHDHKFRDDNCSSTGSTKGGRRLHPYHNHTCSLL